MSKTTEILDNLKSLNLGVYPEDKIIESINQLRPIGFVTWTIPKGFEIIRARLNEDKSFISRCQLTYSPPTLNNGFGRAHGPKSSMFYGSLRPDSNQGKVDPRFVPLQECIPLIRDKTTKGIKKITFGRWIVLNEFILAAVIQNQSFIERNPFVKKILENVSWDEVKVKQKALECAEFIADEFAKDDTPNDYDYILTSYFSQYFINAGAAGILYPSVRFEGQVLNVALNPFIADNLIQLDEVYECTVYKYYDKVCVDNESSAKLYNNQTHFNLKQLDSPDHLGVDRCLEILGLKSIDELES